MSITSSDILNLSHALKDVCEVDCCTSPILTQTLRFMAQYNLLQAHIEYNRTLSEANCQHPGILSTKIDETEDTNFCFPHK